MEHGMPDPLARLVVKPLCADVGLLNAAKRSLEPRKKPILQYASHYADPKHVYSSLETALKFNTSHDREATTNLNHRLTHMIPTPDLICVAHEQ